MWCVVFIVCRSCISHFQYLNVNIPSLSHCRYSFSISHCRYSFIHIPYLLSISPIHIPYPYPLSISPIHIPYPYPLSISPIHIPYPYPSQCISLVIINPCPVPISPLLELPRARHGGHDHLQPGATHDGALRRQQRQPRDQQVSGHQTRRALLLTLRTHHHQLYDCAPPRLS